MSGDGREKSTRRTYYATNRIVDHEFRCVGRRGVSKSVPPTQKQRPAAYACTTYIDDADDATACVGFPGLTLGMKRCLVALQLPRCVYRDRACNRAMGAFDSTDALDENVRG